MSLETKGKLYLKYDAQQVTEKFKKREFILELTSGMYSEYIKFQLTQDKCSLIDKFNQGDEINVKFNLRGRPYTSKTGETTYFTNLEAWSIDGANTQAQATQGKSNEVPMPGEKDMGFTNSFDEDDSLPF